MDIKILLLALTFLNAVLEISCWRCCGDSSSASFSIDLDSLERLDFPDSRYSSLDEMYAKKRRSINSNDVKNTEILKRIGTEFSIELKENPCVFETYDIDNDGMITKEELEAKLGAREETQHLLAVIDKTEGDGMIDYYEFHAAAPLIISECKA